MHVRVERRQHQDVARAQLTLVSLAVHPAAVGEHVTRDTSHGVGFLVRGGTVVLMGDR